MTRGKLDMKTDPLTARLGELLADREHANNTDLRCLKPSQAMDNLTSTLLDYRAYCKDHQLKLLSYLLEMTILEAIEVQISVGQDDRPNANRVAIGSPATKMESQNELCGDNHD